MTQPSDLSLYLFEGCPYCERVRNASRALGVQLVERNIHRDPDALTELRDARGRATVPVLRIEGPDGVRWLPESADIVRYLADRFGDGTPPSGFRVGARHGAIALLLAGWALPPRLQSPVWAIALLLIGGDLVRKGWRNQRVIQAVAGTAATMTGLALAWHALQAA